MIFESFTIGIIIPILSAILNNSSDNYFLKIYLDTFFKDSDYNNIVFLSIIILSLIFLSKFIFLVYALFVHTKFYTKFKLFLSQNIFQGYLEMPFSSHVNTNSATILRNTIGETTPYTGENTILKRLYKVKNSSW